ncbi:MAG: secreted protein [Acidimicrobiaceae bacterium]|nr:secreted protein [Acidimicrobiaceae bacterium]
MLVLVGVVLGVVVGTSGGGKKTPASAGSSSSSSSSTTRSTHPVASTRCPLTDVPAPGGKVPARAPLAIKIGNEPGPDAGGLGAARPQSGLNEADIVYDTPAEGGIMRYMAVFQCQSAASIGPVRSVRWVDWHLAAEFPISVIAHVGGITPDVSALDALHYIADGNAFVYPNDFQRISTRYAPDNDYTSTASLWSTFSQARFKSAPSPVFAYTPKLPAAATANSQVAINFSGGTDVVWKYDTATGLYYHYYDTTPDIDTLTNKQVSTTNIVIQVVNYQLGPYPESTGGSGDVESVTTGTGKGYVVRAGKMIPVTWHRPLLRGSTTFTDAAGKPVGLAPGRTWVELLLNTTAKVPGALTFTK